jgi:sugar phosphate isomerase/epimerase
MRLGLDTYSLRWQGWDAFTLLEYAARLNLDNVQFSERHMLESLELPYLESLKRRGDALGVTIELGMLSFDRYSSFFRAEYGTGEEQLRDMIRAAAVVRSPIVRCLLGGQAERLGTLPFEDHVEECLRVVRGVAPLARAQGIKIAVENHGAVDFLAPELRAFVEAAGADVVGVCLDTGNPAFGAEDPVFSTEVLAPYVVATQVRDTRVWTVPEGAMVQWVPLGQGSVDLRRIADLLSAQARAVAFNLETITGSEPTLIPYNDPGSAFWRAYPTMPARDFVRFVRLASSGAPRPLHQQTLPPGSTVLPFGTPGESLKEQQRRHFEESVRYAQDVLGLGERTGVAR